MDTYYFKYRTHSRKYSRIASAKFPFNRPYFRVEIGDLEIFSFIGDYSKRMTYKLFQGVN